MGNDGDFKIESAEDDFLPTVDQQMGMIRDDNQQLSKNHNKGICFIEVGLSNLAFQMILD